MNTTQRDRKCRNSANGSGQSQEFQPREISLQLPSDHRLPALRLTEEPRQPVRPTYLSAPWLAGKEPLQCLLHHEPSLWLSAPGAGPARGQAGQLVPDTQAYSCPPSTNKWLSWRCQCMDHGLPVSRRAIFLCLIGT